MELPQLDRKVIIALVALVAISIGAILYLNMGGGNVQKIENKTETLQESEEIELKIPNKSVRGNFYLDYNITFNVRGYIEKNRSIVSNLTEEEINRILLDPTSYGSLGLFIDNILTRDKYRIRFAVGREDNNSLICGDIENLEENVCYFYTIRGNRYREYYCEGKNCTLLDDMSIENFNNPKIVAETLPIYVVKNVLAYDIREYDVQVTYNNLTLRNAYQVNCGNNKCICYDYIDDNNAFASILNLGEKDIKVNITECLIRNTSVIYNSTIRVFYGLPKDNERVYIGLDIIIMLNNRDSKIPKAYQDILNKLS